MNNFKIPADFKKETVDELEKINSEYKDFKVTETYGNITMGNLFSSGRMLKDIPKVSFTKLNNYVRHLNSKDIKFNYTINGSCFGNKELDTDEIGKLRSFILNLYDIGIKNFTIATPPIIELVKSLELDIVITGSVISQINNVNKAASWKKFGVDRIVIDEMINRDFSTLKDIRNSFGKDVELIVNSICYNNCIYRQYHYNQIAHNSSQSEAPTNIKNYYNHRCMMKRAEDVENVLKLCWIRPEDIHYYNSIGINNFKIQGRHLLVNGDLIKTIKHYFDQHFEGNLLDLINLFSDLNSFKISIDNKKLADYLKPFYNSNKFCRNSCHECNYCKKIANEAIDYKKAEGTNNLALDFYNNYDEFKCDLKKKEENNIITKDEDKPEEMFKGDFTL